MTATDTGLMMLLPALVMGVMFPFSGRLADRVDQRLLLSSGFVILAFSCLLMSNAHPDTRWWTFAGWLIISRIGIGIMAPSINLSAVQGLPMEFLQQSAGADDLNQRIAETEEDISTVAVDLLDHATIDSGIDVLVSNAGIGGGRAIWRKLPSKKYAKSTKPMYSAPSP